MFWKKDLPENGENLSGIEETQRTILLQGHIVERQALYKLATHLLQSITDKSEQLETVSCSYLVGTIVCTVLSLVPLQESTTDYVYTSTRQRNNKTAEFRTLMLDQDAWKATIRGFRDGVG